MIKKDADLSKTTDKPLILASSSPRRKQILADMGLRFEVMPADIDESGVTARSPKALVRRLARAKCDAVHTSDAVTVAADTIVYMRGKIYGKPLTEARAEEMLGELNGRWHTVYTGVCVGYGDKRIQFIAKSKVLFKKLNEGQIRDYVSRHRPLDKAGAYGIQDEQVVAKYRGSYTNIVGLPSEKLKRALRRAGVIQ